MDRKEEILNELLSQVDSSRINIRPKAIILTPDLFNEGLETYAREKTIEELENLKKQAEFFMPKTAEPPINEWVKGKLSTNLNLIKYLEERILKLKNEAI